MKKYLLISIILFAICDINASQISVLDSTADLPNYGNHRIEFVTEIPLTAFCIKVTSLNDGCRIVGGLNFDDAQNYSWDPVLTFNKVTQNSIELYAGRLTPPPELSMGYNIVGYVDIFIYGYCVLEITSVDAGSLDENYNPVPFTKTYLVNPEPATITMISVGALTILMRKKKKLFAA